MTECKVWTGSTDTSGYGQKRISGKLYSVHRLAFCQAFGLPLSAISGLAIMHTCDNPRCFEKSHLVPGTWADNNRDRARKGRSAKAVPSRRKITQAQAEDIRNRYVRYSKDNNAITLAREYGVDPTTIHNIVKRRTHT